MRVEILKECRVTLDRINTRLYPKGWKGEVPAEILATFNPAHFREDVPERAAQPDGHAPPQLSAEQVQFLAAFADGSLQILAEDQGAGGEAHAVAAGGEERVEMGGESPDLTALPVAELRALAIEHGVTGASRMKKAELIAALGG